MLSLSKQQYENDVKRINEELTECRKQVRKIEKHQEVLKRARAKIKKTIIFFWGR